jgi:hypothetical protein
VPQHFRGGNPAIVDFSPAHGDLAVRAATSQYSTNWIERSRLRRLRKRRQQVWRTSPRGNQRMNRGMLCGRNMMIVVIAATDKIGEN